MAIPKPTPLYPTYIELCDISFSDYPELNDLFVGQPDWWATHWSWGKSFLEYTGRNKSEHTYTRFRNEIERFLLWSFLIKEKSIDDFRKTDILEYADFCWKPPVTWIGTSSLDRFKLENGFFKSNSKWRPYKLQAPKSQQTKTIDKKKI